MAYTVGDLKTELTGVLHGTTLAQVVGLDNIIDRAARKLLNDIDPIETVRIQQLTSPLFDQVYDYMCPADLKDDRIVDVRPQVNRILRDRFFQTYNEDFDLSKYLVGNVSPAQITVQYNTGVKSLRLAQNLTPALLVNNVDSINGDSGTWTTFGTAYGLAVDTLNYVSGSGSLLFNLAAGANPSFGGIVNSTMQAVDLTEQANQGSLFDWSWIPNFNQVISLTLRWGSSVTDYWERVETVTQNSLSFQNGWNLIQNIWDGATVVGSPDATSITYALMGVTYDGTENFNYRFNSITAQLGTIYELEYYSKYIFRSAISGAFQETVDNNSNIINLDTTGYNMLFNLVAYFTSQQVQAQDSVFDYKFFLDEYIKEMKRYVAKIRSQVIQPRQQYYTLPSKRTVWIREGY